MERQALIEQIMSEQLINPVSGFDVERDDVHAYLDEIQEPSIDGFKAWLNA